MLALSTIEVLVRVPEIIIGILLTGLILMFWEVTFRKGR